MREEVISMLKKTVVALVLFFMILIVGNIMYSFLTEKTGFDYPIWLQIVMVISFSVLAIMKVQTKNYIVTLAASLAIILLITSLLNT